MSTEKRIGKIYSIKFGKGGYQEACLGVTVDLRSENGWGVEDFNGTWGGAPSPGAQWTVEDQTKRWGEMVRWIADLLKKSKKESIDQLKGVPVEVEFEGMKLKSWRILEEVL